MAEGTSIIALVAGFIGIAIMLGVGVQILGNVQSSTNCNTLPGFNASGINNLQGNLSANATKIITNKPSTAMFSGWALSCVNNNSSMQSAYALLFVSMIVTAAVAILFVVRML